MTTITCFDPRIPDWAPRGLVHAGPCSPTGAFPDVSLTHRQQRRPRAAEPPATARPVVALPAP